MRGVAMDEATGDPRAGNGEKQQSSSSPVHETRLAALRRAEIIVLQGGYTATSTSGRTSPTLLQRSNSIRTQSAGSPSSSKSDLLSLPHSPHSRSPQSSNTETLELPRGASPRFRSTSAKFFRNGSFPRKGWWRVVLWKRCHTLCFVVLFLFFALDWLYLSSFQQPVKDLGPSQADFVREDGTKSRTSTVMYDRLLALAAHRLAENEFKPEREELWEELTQNDSTWLPCANQRPENHNLSIAAPPLPKDSTGYIMVNANGDLSQQRVAVCNAVAVARMLTATLVLPIFSFSNQGRDSSQFKDLYMEDYFIDYLKDDVQVVKELPVKLQSLDLHAMKAVVTDDDVPKEAKPSIYLQHILPLLLKTGVVLFEGFGNRLAFDPVPSDIQALRCRCNFHALRFVPELQRVAKLTAERMRDKHTRWGPGDDEFQLHTKSGITFAKNVPKYLAIHLHFEMNMSTFDILCEPHKEELRAYVEEHFALLHQDEKLDLAALQEELGVCPLMPEESFLILAALGFKRGTRIYLAGVYPENELAKMSALKFMYPNLVTKEDILTAEELQPLRNHASQLAVLDYVACSSANVFVVTNPSSQLSALVAGHRIYYGFGHAPTLCPSRNRLATLFHRNATIEWSCFEDGIRNVVSETTKIAARPVTCNIYSHPRCEECMCEHSV